MVDDPKVGEEGNLDPNQDPNADGKNGAAGTPDPNLTGAAGEGSPDPNEPKTVPITALHEERDKRQSVQAQLDQMKTMLGDKVTYDSGGMPLMQPDVPAAQPNSNVAELDKLWEEDPRKAVQTELQMALDWYDGVNAAMDAQEDVVKQQHSDFDQFRGEVRRYIRKLPPAQRARQGIVEMAYLVVKGQNVDKIVEQRNSELLRKIQAGESIQGLTGTYSSPAVQPDNRVLNQEEKATAAAMNMTDEDYMKWKK